MAKAKGYSIRPQKLLAMGKSPTVRIGKSKMAKKKTKKKY